MKRSEKYQDWLIEKLKNHDLAVAYLSEALQESLRGDAESQSLFLVALRNVAELVEKAYTKNVTRKRQSQVELVKGSGVSLGTEPDPKLINDIR